MQDFEFFGETLALYGSLGLVSGRASDDEETTRVHLFEFDSAGATLRQTVTTPIGSPHVFANNTVAIGQQAAMVGEALHADNLDGEPSASFFYRLRRPSAAEWNGRR